MTHPIKTREYHEAQIARIDEAQQRRFDQQLDVMDCGLSNWADQNSRIYHKQALRIIESGMVSTFWALFDGDREVAASLRHGDFGPYWLLDDSEADLIAARGKRFIPCKFGDGGARSIVAKMGLSERKIEKPVAPYFRTACAGVGCPIAYIPVAANGNGAGA